jgi:HEAT repeat protein
LELLGSRYEVVREAVRESLAEFHFKRFLAAYDTMEPAVRASTAPLVRKVDPECLALLVEEMKSSARTRRLRAIEIAVAMNAVRAVETPLIALLADEDHMVRASAARAMEQTNSGASQEALQSLLSDRSHMVQEAAREALAAQGQRARFPSFPIGPGTEGMPVYE